MFGIFEILNYSFDDVPRSVMLKYPVSYTSNIAKTKDVIQQVIRKSPLTIPAMHMPDGSIDYAPVYFIEISDSALIMSVTVYYKSSTPTEKVKDQINTEVFSALIANGIDIPYNYMNVVVQNKN